MSSLVVTKIVRPGQSRLLLRRPRLLDFLHQQIHRKLIILSAPVGYGKTSLLVDFAHETPLPVCWYSLDASDRDAQVFLRYLIAAIQRRFPQIGDRALAVLSNGSGCFDCDAVIGALVTEMQEDIPDPFVIVLDDYHTVADTDAVNHIVDTLLLLLPEKAHLILSSRTLPAGLALTRLAVRQELAALSASELQFNAEEVRSLFANIHHTDLSPEQAAEIAARSEGWIAGILLTTPLMWQGLLPHLDDQDSRERLFHLLATETFLHLSSELQRFLLDSAVLSRLDAETCNDVLEIQNAAEMLQIVEDRNLFLIRLSDAHRLSYRYHSLFREFLCERLRRTDRRRWHALNRRAAEFYETRAEWRGQAVRHYLTAEMYAEAARVIAAIGQSAFDSGHWTTLAEWIDALPAHLATTHPHLLLLRGEVHAEMGHFDQAESAYARAIALYEQGHDLLSAAKPTLCRAMLWRMQGRYREAIDACQQVLGTLQKNAAGREEAQVWRIMGTAHALLGDLPRSESELEKSLHLHEALGDPMRVAWLHHDLGTCLRSRGAVGADQHFAQALAFWRDTQNTVGMATTLNSIGVGHHRDGRYAQALDVLEQARALAHRMGNRRIEAFALTSLGDVHRDLSAYARALELYQQAAGMGHDLGGFILAYALVALGETYRLSGDRVNAAKYLHRALETAQHHQSNYEIGLVETAFGILEYAQGQVEGGTRHLSRAVELLKTIQRDEARARLHLAQGYLLLNQYQKTNQQLKAIVGGPSSLPATAIPFLVADRAHVRPVLQYAVGKKVGDSYFRKALDKLDALERTAPGPAPSPAPTVEARALGTVQVCVGERIITRVDWGTQTTKELFFLTLEHPEGLRKEQILETLWPDRSASQASVIFHNVSYRLRRVVPHGFVYEDGEYHLRRDLNIDYDVTRFRKLMQRARDTQNEVERLQHYKAAVELYRGDYFEECYSDWCLDVRERLRRHYVDALLALGQMYEQRGDYTRAIGYYQTLVDQDRDREDVYRELMRLQYRTGDRTSAVRTYRQCAQVLKEELNIPSPSRETLALYERIVNEG